jgi:hypothetical protein
MLTAAKKRQLDAVLVWRFARSTQTLVNALKEFQHLGVDSISYRKKHRHHYAHGRADFPRHGLAGSV